MIEVVEGEYEAVFWLITILTVIQCFYSNDHVPT